jgi:hypothetical protein
VNGVRIFLESPVVLLDLVMIAVDTIMKNRYRGCEVRGAQEYLVLQGPSLWR